MFCHFGRILATNPRVSHRRRVVPSNSDALSMRLVAFGPLGIPKRQKSTDKLHTATRLHHGVTPWRTCCACSAHESPPRRPPASPTTPAPPIRRVTAAASASRAPTAPDLPRAVTRRAARFPAATTPSSVIGITADGNEARPRPGTRQRRPLPRRVLVGPADSARSPTSPTCRRARTLPSCDHALQRDRHHR